MSYPHIVFYIQRADGNIKPTVVPGLTRVLVTFLYTQRSKYI